jgi:hypothetical protein
MQPEALASAGSRRGGGPGDYLRHGGSVQDAIVEAGERQRRATWWRPGLHGRGFFSARSRSGRPSCLRGLGGCFGGSLGGRGDGAGHGHLVLAAAAGLWCCLARRLGLKGAGMPERRSWQFVGVARSSPE